jgi:hypothetical protein
MKSCPPLSFFLYVCLLLFAVWLLVKPQAVIAAEGSANCGGGVTVSCRAYHCDCIDGVGCTAYDASGNKIEGLSKSCPAVTAYYGE